MTTSVQEFKCFYINDGSNARIESVQNVLHEMSIGAKRVIFGWVVTRLQKDKYEVGTIGNPENVFSAETVSEGIASSTNWTFD